MDAETQCEARRLSHRVQETWLEGSAVLEGLTASKRGTVLMQSSSVGRLTKKRTVRKTEEEEDR